MAITEMSGVTFSVVCETAMVCGRIRVFGGDVVEVDIAAGSAEPFRSLSIVDSLFSGCLDTFSLLGVTAEFAEGEGPANVFRVTIFALGSLELFQIETNARSYLPPLSWKSCLKCGLQYESALIIANPPIDNFALQCLHRKQRLWYVNSSTLIDSVGYAILLQVMHRLETVLITMAD